MREAEETARTASDKVQKLSEQLEQASEQLQGQHSAVELAEVQQRAQELQQEGEERGRGPGESADPPAGRGGVGRVGPGRQLARASETPPLLNPARRLPRFWTSGAITQVTQPVA
jgi:hypothetical protein